MSGYYRVMIGFPNPIRGKLYYSRKWAEKAKKKLEKKMPGVIIWMERGLVIDFNKAGTEHKIKEFDKIEFKPPKDKDCIYSKEETFTAFETGYYNFGDGLVWVNEGETIKMKKIGPRGHFLTEEE